MGVPLLPGRCALGKCPSGGVPEDGKFPEGFTPLEDYLILDALSAIAAVHLEER